MLENLRRFWLTISIGFVGFLGILGSDVMTGLLRKFCPDIADWIKENPIVYILIWGLVFLNSILYKKNHDKGIELKQLRGDDHDLSMGDAINYIQKTEKAWKHSPPEVILKKITDLAFEEKIKIWGEPEGEGQDSISMDYPKPLIKIPCHFFYDVAGGLIDNRGYMLERFSKDPGTDKVTRYKCIYNVMVNRGQITAMFSRYKPKA